MVTFDMAIPYGVRRADRKSKNADGSPAPAAEDRTLTDFLLTHAISAKFPPQVDAQGRAIGLGGIKSPTDRKMAGKIHNVLTAAEEAGSSTVELTEAQFEWLRDVVAAWEAPPQWAGWWETLDRAMKKLADALEEAPAAKNGVAGKTPSEVAKP